MAYGGVSTQRPSDERSNIVADKKVTIIVGIYNSEEFLAKGLESIRNQTWENIEVLMMDDGSTDSSGKICDEFAKTDPRFIPVHKENSGVCDSRNKGLDMASGDYVCFMDGDDWFSDDFVEYMMQIIASTNTEMALSCNVFTTRDQTQIDKDKIEVWSAQDTICKLIYPGIKMGPWNKIYSLRVIRENGIKFPDHWFGETLHFASSVAYQLGKVGVGHRKVYNYRLNNINSGTTQYNVNYRLMSLDNGRKLKEKEFAKNPEVMVAIEWRFYVDHFSLLMNILGSDCKTQYEKEYKQARKYLKDNFLPVFKNSKVNIKQKMGLIGIGLFPDLAAKGLIRLKTMKLRKDVNGH